MSIARTHDFLDRSSVGEASIRRLVAMELEPFVDDMATRVRMDGPVILLESSPVLALGLTLHELATNAAKYGALSEPQGRIQVTWSLRSEGDQTFVDLEWKESGGQTVVPPRRRGFGSRLIEGSIAGTLAGSVTMDYLAEGLVARLSFPLPAAAKTETA
jgi:two-component sensor histidine kinase